MIETGRCSACGSTTKAAVFCARCWRLAERGVRYEVGWWHDEFRRAASRPSAEFAYACWAVTVSWASEIIKDSLARRQAARVLRKAGARKRPKTLAELALEAEDAARGL